MTKKHAALMAFVAQLTKESTEPPHVVADVAISLLPIARSMDRINVRQCNGHQTWDGRWDEDAAAKDEKREERLTAKAEKLVARLGDGFGIRTNGDPRGFALFVTLPSGRTNDWGERGWAVPE